MTYLSHITLSTGHLAHTSRARRSPRSEVSDDTIKAMRPWLDAVLVFEDDYPLPGPLGARDGFVVQASVLDGALICHVGQMQTGPMATFGVVAKSRQSGAAWAWLCAQYGNPNDLKQPATPWCGVVLHDGYLRQAGASAWLCDFERCVAWTWLERNP